MATQTQALSKQLVMINNFLIDVSISEDHVFESEVTEFPVEKGADITDNIRPKPLKVTIEGIVSNSPVNPDIIANRSSIDESVDDAYGVLTKIWENGEPVDIRTSLRSYTSMAMQSLNIPRSRGGADALRFTASFQQVTIVDNTRTTRVATPIAIKSKDVGGGVPKQSDLGPLFKVLDVASIRVPLFQSTAAGTTYGRIWKARFWYDTNIEGWREGAVNNLGQGWVFTRGKVYGATDVQWAGIKSDVFWKNQIATVTAQEHDNPGTGATFDPFNNIIGGAIPTMSIVHGRRG